MKKYAVAHFDSYEGKLSLFIVKAESELHACYKALIDEKGTQELAEHNYEDLDGFMDVEAPDDFWIEVKEVV